MNRKIFFALFITLLLLPSHIHALELPDKIHEWHSVSEHVMNLIAAAGNKDLGKCTYKNYERESPRGYLQVILTEGSGTGSLYVPERVNDSKGVMSSPSGYEIVNVSGHNGIIEHHEYMPLALAVSVSKDIILTVESSSLDDKAIIELAEEIVKNFTEGE